MSAITSPDTRYGCPMPNWCGNIGITLEASCTHHGRSTWGYRLTCEGCGKVDACAIGSSVSYEDAPPRFAYDHRACNAVARAASVQVKLEKQLRHSSPTWSYLYYANVTDERALELASEYLAASCSDGWEIVGASRDF